MLDDADMGRIREIVRDELAAARGRRVSEDPIGEALARWVNGRERFTAAEAWAALGLPVPVVTAGTLSRVGKAAAALGYVRVREGSGRRAWYYERKAANGQAA